MGSKMLKQQILAAAAYPLIAFPLAIIWHLIRFKDRYTTFGYFKGAPNIAVGMASMAIQVAVLAAFCPMFRFGRSGLGRAVTFTALLGQFFWTRHVLALENKQNVPQAGTFILMETVYLCSQFGLFALALVMMLRGAEPTCITPA